MSVPFHDEIVFESGLASDNSRKGYESLGGSTYGRRVSGGPLAFDANGVQYRIRSFDQLDGEVDLTLTPDPPTDAKWSVRANGHDLTFQAATKINSLEYGTDGTLYQWQNQPLDLIPGSGQQFTFVIGNAIDDELDRVEEQVIANRPQVMDDRHVEGLAVGNLANSQKDDLHALRPIFTLGTSPDSVFLYEAQAGISSGNNLSFLDYGQRSGVVFSKSIAAANVYATLSNEGVLLGEWHIQQGAGTPTQIGSLRAYIVKNNDDQIGWYIDWDAGSGSDGMAGGFQVTVSVARMAVR